MYPDVLLISSPQQSIAAHTLQSIHDYAHNSNVFLFTGLFAHNSYSNSLLAFRLEVLKRATSDWVVFIDTDDGFDIRIPDNEMLAIGGHDLHIYSYYDVDSKHISSIYNAGFSKLFGFCMVICRRELAIKALIPWQKIILCRDDLCFLYGVLKHSKNFKIHSNTLTQKFGSRFARFADSVTKLKLSEEVKKMAPLFSQDIFNGKIIDRKVSV